MQGILTRLGRNNTGHHQILSEFKASRCNVEQFNAMQSRETFTCGFGVASSTFRKDKFRGEKVKLITPVPKLVSALLMAGFNYVLAWAGCQVANNGSFDIYLTFHFVKYS